jgi:ComF family protein
MAGTYCSVCGERMMSPLLATNTSENARCGVCRRVEPPYVRALAYGSYDGGLRELIHLLKYERVRPAVNVLGRMLADVIKELAPSFDGDVAMVPVPLHRSKQRQREFNQTELIARSALKLLPAGSVRLDSTMLERRRATQSQIGLSSHQRRENLRGAFLVPRPSDMKGKTILLVDDVFTTGTTVSECARVLRRAGASKVWVATVARTLKHDSAGMKLQPIVSMPTEIIATKTMAAAS